MTIIRVRRESRAVSVSLGTSTSSATTLSVAGMAGGAVVVSGLTSSATITLFGSSDGVSFSPLLDASGAQATVVLHAGDTVVSLPDAVYPLRLLKLVADADAGTAASVTVSLKS